MGPAMFVLTNMTGRNASANRTVVIGTVELNWRVWIIMIAAFPVAVLLVAVLIPFAGVSAILALPIVEALAVFMVHRRTKNGLKVRTYQAIIDKQRSGLNKFYVGNSQVDLRDDQFATIINSAVVNPEFDTSNPSFVPYSLATRNRPMKRGVPVKLGLVPGLSHNSVHVNDNIMGDIFS